MALSIGPPIQPKTQCWGQMRMDDSHASGSLTSTCFSRTAPTSSSTTWTASWARSRSHYATAVNDDMILVCLPSPVRICIAPAAVQYRLSMTE